MRSVVLVALVGCAEPVSHYGPSTEERPPDAAISVERTRIDFGVVPPGSDPIERVAVNNTAPLRGGAVILSAITSSSDRFAVIAPPTEVLPGSGVLLEVQFLPREPDTVVEGVLTILSNDADRPEVEVALRGEVATAHLDVPSDLAFPETERGTTTWLDLDLTSTGTLPVTVDRVVAGPPFSADGPVTPFEVVGAVSVAVGFAPETDEVYAGELLLETSVGSVRVELTGTGTWRTSEARMVTVVDRRQADVAYLVDGTVDAEAVTALDDVHAAVAEALPVTTAGLAVIGDYRDFGGPDEVPFTRLQQQTSAVDRWSAALGAHVPSAAADGTVAGFEALYQVATGHGWDADCDAALDDGDVRPFVARPIDAFAGLVPGAYDPTVPDTGSGGGMGFVGAEQLPVVVVATATPFRDPDLGDPAPGGCHQDATAADAAAALGELGAPVVAIALSDDPQVDTQLDALVTATGGERISLDDPAAVADAIARHVPHRCFDTVHLEVDDPGGLIAGIAPATLDDACAGELWSWDLTLHGVFVDTPTDTTVEVPWEVIADDAVVLSAGLLLVEPY